MQATYGIPKSARTSGVVVAALLAALLLGGIGGYAVKGVVSSPEEHPKATLVDPITGYQQGTADDQRILAFLQASGYEGGGTVVPPGIDPVTGYPYGSADDQSTLAFLKHSGYEGGGTVVAQGSTP